MTRDDLIRARKVLGPTTDAYETPEEHAKDAMECLRRENSQVRRELYGMTRMCEQIIHERDAAEELIREIICHTPGSLKKAKKLLEARKP